MRKHGNRYFKGALIFLMSVSFLSLAACSKTPMQKVLDSDPDIFAQAVNGNFYPGGALFLRTECIHAVVDPAYISVLVNSDKYSNLQYPPNRVIKECGRLFSDLASRMETNTEFKGLTEKDFDQSSIWEHYYKSSIAKFNFKEGDDE